MKFPTRTSLRSTVLAAFLVGVLTPTSLAQDTCATAQTIGLGTTAFDTTGSTDSGLPWTCATGTAGDIWFQYFVEGDRELVISACGSSAPVELEAMIYCGASDAALCSEPSSSCTGSVVHVNPVLTTRILIRLSGVQGMAAVGNLTIEQLALAYPEDDCTGRIPVTNGSTPFSTVGSTFGLPAWGCASVAGDIWFTVVSAGAVTVDTFGSSFDTTLEIFEGSCRLPVSVDCSDDAGGTLQSMVTTPSTPGVTYFVRVGGKGAASGSGVLNVTGAAPMPTLTLGANYCNARMNSTGVPAHIDAVGSAYVADNSVTLQVSDLPQMSFGYCIVSMSTGFVPNPGQNQGNLCLRGLIGRYIGPGQVFNSGLTGTAAVPIDLTRTPQPPMSFEPMLTGDRWSFQAWYRDTDGQGFATTNFTDGVTVDFF